MAGAGTGKISVEELTALVAAGDIDTIVTAVCDMQGRLVGKRVTGQFFIDHCLAHGARFVTCETAADEWRRAAGEVPAAAAAG